MTRNRTTGTPPPPRPHPAYTEEQLRSFIGTYTTPTAPGLRGFDEVITRAANRAQDAINSAPPRGASGNPHTISDRIEITMEPRDAPVTESSEEETVRTGTSAVDLERSYCGTYIGLRTAGGIVPAYVTGVRNASVPELVLASFGASSNRHVRWDSPDLVYQHPDLGYAMVRDSLYWMERLPKRQWHKGIKPELVEVYLVGGRKVLLRDMPQSEQYTLLADVYKDIPSTNKYICMYQNAWYYKGKLICAVDALDTIPEQLSYIKDIINSFN